MSDSRSVAVLTAYPVVEQFYTIQGEGRWSGRPAYFLRLGGCDVGCPWCDTKESWPEEDHPHVQIEELVDRVRATEADTVVVTGGEPTMHDLVPLTEALAGTGTELHLETSGAYPISGTFDWVTLSPKKFKPPVEENYARVDELKVVVFNRSDLEWAKTHAARCAGSVRLSLQPEWSAREKVTPLIVEFVKRNPRWTISLQTHKYLDVP